MRSRWRTYGVLGSFAIILSSCGGGGGGKADSGTGGAGGMNGNTGTGGSGAAVTFAQVRPLFGNCTFCHSGIGTELPGVMNLDTAPAASLVDVDSLECAGMGGRKRVAPGSPGTSYLLDKVKGTNLCSGGQMPLNQPMLGASEIAIIEGWIASGAPTE